jgi:hypothetical protein
MSKRPTNSNFYAQSKKFRSSASSVQVTANENVDESSFLQAPSDTEAALLYLKSKFPTEKFEGRLPPVLLVHQIYSIIKCKTLVDRDVVSICPSVTA